MCIYKPFLIAALLLNFYEVSSQVDNQWRNNPFALALKAYFSGDVTLTTDSLNYYDPRIIGTWIDSSKHEIILVAQIENGLRLTHYYFNQPNQMYYQQVIRSNYLFTNIGDSYFIESNFGGQLTKADRSYPDNYFPCNYSFTGNDSMCVKKISYLALKKEDCSTTQSYRLNVLEHSSDSNFYNSSYQYFRLRTPFPHKNLLPDNNTQVFIGIAVLLAGAALILDMGGNNVPDPVTNQRVIEGYDQYWNPIYQGGGFNSSGQLYYDINKKRIE